MNPLPPQAYTKDTLLKAYSWLQNQPNNIKEIASTPDILVSLYLKTTRDGEGALSRPSIQNFKNELKQLAGMMGDLEAPVAPAAPMPTAPSVAPVLPPLASAMNYSNETSNTSAYQVHLDSKSWFMIQEVKENLNLSSDMEALRALIKIGSARIKNSL
ncbi:MAG: hypothetical protein AABY64_10675 [Bdellovibrionota bacterium]